MAKRSDELFRDLEQVVAKHHDWIHDEAWMKACQGVGAGYFAKIAHSYDALTRFIEAMRLEYQDEDEEQPNDDD